VLWWALETLTDSHVAVADAATTAASLVAQYMLNRKWIQNWFVWAGVDVVFAGLALSQGLWLTGILYVVFLGICVAAWWSWRGMRAAQLRAADEAVRA
jgi:nicotinamide mononucleotide transporter